MPKPLKILIIEDRPEDAELLVFQLKQAGFETDSQRVEREDAYRAALSPDLDVIFSDYSLPQFSTQRALDILIESRFDVPFIVVSGTIGEERAVESLKGGATDYVLKDRIQRIGPAVERARKEAELRRERKRLEQQLQLQATAIETAANAIAITTPDGQFIWVNPAFTQITGYTAEEVIGRGTRILKSDKHDLEFYRILWKTILSGKTWQGEFTNRRKDGALYYAEQTITPVRGPAGEVTHFIAIMNDVTEKKQLERQFLRTQRLDSIGTLAAGIAHDLNNTLAPIMMSIDILRTQLSDPDSLGLIELLSSSAQRGADMVKQLLTFSRGIDGTPALLQVRHLLREIHTVTRQTFPKNIRINLQTPKDLWPIVGDVTQLHQLLLNLCLNARDAMGSGGTLTLKASNVLLDEHFAMMHMEAKPGPYLLLSVVDTGTGISPEIRSRIFDPFFTTKQSDKGTGLGLSIVKAIVKSHGGFLTFSSEAAVGTEFTIYLPARPSENPKSTERTEPQLTPGNGEVILVVDDEEAVRVLSKKTLEAFGYVVFTAGDGAQAVAVCAREWGKINLLVTDLAMPIMDGTSTIRAVRLIDPRIKIIACSGLANPPKKDAAALDADAFMQKPFTAEQLLKTIREVLDRKPVPS